MREWLEEFLVVTDASLGLRLKLICIPIVPALIATFGAYQVDSVPPPGQYSALLSSVREAAFPLYLAVAFVSLIGCIRMFAKEYRRVHRRLFG